MNDSQYIGLDYELINLIYFAAESDKQNYLRDVDIILNELTIRPGKEMLVVLESIADSTTDLPFVREILAFSNNLQYSKSTDRNNYYTNCKLCEHNILRKLEDGNTDFEMEEVLFGKMILADFNGYAKLNLLFVFGEVYATLNNKEKRDFCFSLLRESIFEISAVTVSEFYKLIAELYVANDEREMGLNWYTAGLLLNPKLAVKKAMKVLEK